MANLSQSQFLQALGWATLGSLWQIAFLWIVFQGFIQIRKTSSESRYRLAFAALSTGFIWFLYSFIQFYGEGGKAEILPIYNLYNAGGSFLQIVLTSASLSYLALLLIPVWKWFQNIYVVKSLQVEGHGKAALHYRMFTQKMAMHLSIPRKVVIGVSERITSPLTLGFFKPLILLPLSAFTQLTQPQLEAVILHELSHIKRNDYLINLISSLIHTLLYFNPFVRCFIRSMEADRESSCDNLVIQFGYDRVSYASALLCLEKNASRLSSLTLAATGNQRLLARIEKIVGMESRKDRNRGRLLSFFSALFLIFLAHSYAVKTNPETRSEIDFTKVSNPFIMDFSGDSNSPESEPPPAVVEEARVASSSPYFSHSFTSEEIYDIIDFPAAPPEPPLPPEPGLISVAVIESGAMLQAREAEQVSAAVDVTKKVLSDLQWKDVESQIGEVMTLEERRIAELEIKKEIEKINWENVKKNMESKYETINWQKVNEQLSQALTQMHYDSLENNYRIILNEVKKAEAGLTRTRTSALPDASLCELAEFKAKVRSRLDSLQSLKSRPVVKL